MKERSENRISMELSEDSSASLGMLIALISWGMLFATFFLAYAVYRASQPVWPPVGIQRVPLLLPGVSTLVLFLSSFFYLRFSSSAQRIDREKMKNSYIITLALALLFMAVQFLFWRNLKAHGIFAESGIFGSLIYGMTWVHAAHVILGLLGILFLYPLTFKNDRQLSRREFNWILNIGKFWHFLGIVWLLMFVTIFVF